MSNTNCRKITEDNSEKNKRIQLESDTTSAENKSEETDNEDLIKEKEQYIRKIDEIVDLIAMIQSKQAYFKKEEKGMNSIRSNIQQCFDEIDSFVDKLKDKLKIRQYGAVYFSKSDDKYFGKCGIVNEVTDDTLVINIPKTEYVNYGLKEHVGGVVRNRSSVRLLHRFGFHFMTKMETKHKENLID